MLQSSLKLSSFEVAPQLALFYRSSHQRLLRVSVYVPADSYSLFECFEDDLRRIAVKPRDYSDTVVLLLEGWLKEHRLKAIPIKTFCGQWALKQYKAVRDSQTVEITFGGMDALIYTEMLVARKYIEDNRAGNRMRFGDEVAELRELLDSNWLELYESKDKARGALVNKVVSMLAKEYGLKNVFSYNDIWTA